MSSSIHSTYSDPHQSACEWARALFNQPRFLVLDTETTGLGRDDELVSIGIVDGQGNVVLDSLIKPSKPIPWQVTRVHGIRDRDVKDAPTFADLYPEIKALLADYPVVVYNLSFDRRMIQQSQRRYGLAPIRYRDAHCAMLMYAQYYGQVNSRFRSFRWHSLSNACAHQGIAAVNTHNAVGDALLTLEIVRRMAR